MEYTIEITTYCPNNCDYCSTMANTKGRGLNINIIKEFINTIPRGSRINISGGEPLSHPYFWEILQSCYGITDDVWVYTNALRQIRYNANVIDEVIVEANVCLVPGQDIYIPEKADKVRLLQLVSTGRAKDMKPANIHVSGNIRDGCQGCSHKVLQADGKIVDAPCKKDYGQE